MTAAGHPEHMETSGWPKWQPAQPSRSTGLLGWKQRHACRRRGGHWWHTEDAMIGWFCCRCGAERDGMPEDGT